MTRPRPLYFRLLGVRHLRAGPVVAFVLFEGSLAVGVLLAFADIVNWWAVLAIPVAVAIMVKIHDRVARALVQPLAVVQMSASRPLRERPKVGRSAVPVPSRPTTEIARDDAVASPEAQPDRYPLEYLAAQDVYDDAGRDWAMGVAPVVRGRAAVPGTARPTPGPRGPLPSEQGTEESGAQENGQGHGEGDDEHGGGHSARRGEGPPSPGFPKRADPTPMRSDRLDPETRARGNQGHFDL
jgi:hypothetical protein